MNVSKTLLKQHFYYLIIILHNNEGQNRLGVQFQDLDIHSRTDCKCYVNKVAQSGLDMFLPCGWYMMFACAPMFSKTYFMALFWFIVVFLKKKCNFTQCVYFLTSPTRLPCPWSISFSRMIFSFRLFLCLDWFLLCHCFISLL